MTEAVIHGIAKFIEYSIQLNNIPKPIYKTTTMEHNTNTEITFEDFLKANPYKHTRSFDEQQWRADMFDLWLDEKKERESKQNDNNKEVKHTEGKWKVNRINYNMFETIYGKTIGMVNTYGFTKEETKAYAEIIVKAVNNHEKLIRELKCCMTEIRSLAKLDTVRHKNPTYEDAKFLLELIEKEDYENK